VLLHHPGDLRLSAQKEGWIAEVDWSTQDVWEAYGLGLSIAKRIVEAHDGTIAVANNPIAGRRLLSRCRKSLDPDD
jgi:K+-sensing histidine kinase KdpD